MDYRNAKYIADGRIDCEVSHPTMGWVPFTASPDDVEKRGRDLFAQIEADGGAAAYVPPDPADELASWREAARVPRAVFAIASAKAGLVSEKEAEDWAAGTAIPAWVSDAIEAAISAGKIPAGKRLEMRVAVRTQETIGRGDSLIPILAVAAGLTPEQTDTLFQ